MSGRPAGDRGSATVWMIALSGVLAAVGVAVVLVGLAAVARHRAAAAADLAALAGAARAVVGDPGACAVAGEVAAANGAVVDRCATGPGGELRVWVHVPVRLGPVGTGAAHARARAGPAEAGPAEAGPADASGATLRLIGRRTSGGPAPACPFRVNASTPSGRVARRNAARSGRVWLRPIRTGRARTMKGRAR